MKKKFMAIATGLALFILGASFIFSKSKASKFTNSDAYIICGGLCIKVTCGPTLLFSTNGSMQAQIKDNTGTMINLWRNSTCTLPVYLTCSGLAPNR
ncbi:hypothetical protein [Chitinophaga lutea]|uniref:hypothetical protein n=1 Tax=Chitinophaga lutea TaxID=2488634 RepID=UPI000F501BEB|nr:hypothetical protein [Chitinophaga lutea]